MKKYFLVIFVLVLLLSACGNRSLSKKKLEKETTTTSSIDETLLAAITGQWYQDQKDYQISYNDGHLNFDEQKLVIEFTDKNTVITHLLEDEKFTYSFHLEKGKLTVGPSYRIESDPKNPSTGGDLAPIYLERKPAIGLTEIYGSWKSTEADYPVQVMIKPTFHHETILLLEKNSSTEDHFSETELVLAENTDTLFSFLNTDKSLEYRISFLEDGNMLVVFSTYSEKDNSTPNLGRPYILTKNK